MTPPKDNVSYLSGMRGDGGGSDDGDPPMSDLTARVEHLEADMRSVREDVAVIKSNYATKADISEMRAEMHSALRQQTMWSVGTIIAMAGLVFAIMRFLPAG